MRKYMLLLGGLSATVACSSTSGDVLDARDGAAQDASFDGGADAIGDAGDGGADAPVDAPTDAPACAPDAAFDSDPANCGRCGHDCQRGACVQGACQPVLLGSCFQPFGVAVDDARVYWTCTDGTRGEVRSVRKDGSLPITHARDKKQPTWVAVDATTLVFTESGTGEIWQADKVGGAPRLFYDAHSPGGPFTFAFDANGVYWIDIYGNASVFAAPRTGVPDGGAPLALATGQPYLFAIAQDATNVYFTVNGDWIFGRPDAGDGKSAVMKAPKDGSSAAVALVRGAAQPRFVEVDANAVYWANALDDTVVRLDNGTSTPVVIARVKQPWGVALDGDYVYVTAVATDTSDGTLVRVRKDGTGSPVVMAAGLSFPTKPVVDATAIYWVNNAGNTIMKVAK